MKPSLLPSGRQRGIAFIIPADWSACQALAVVEPLDDLRELICTHYRIPLRDLLREQNLELYDSNDPIAETIGPPF